MRGTRLLFTSDLHLDWLFQKMPAAKKEMRRREIVHTLNFIVATVKEKRVQGVLIAGDLFHSNYVSSESLQAVMNFLYRLQEMGVKVLLLPGNHDSKLAEILLTAGNLPENVYLFDRPEWTAVEVTPGVFVHGFPFVPELAQERLLGRLRLNQADNNLVLFHGTFGKDLPVEEKYYPITVEDAARCGAKAVLLGHYHNHSLFQAGDVPVIYSGTPHALSFQENDDRVVLLLEIERDSFHYSPISVPGRRCRTLEVDLATFSPDVIREKLLQEGERENCWRVILKGAVETDTAYQVKNIQAEVEQKVFFVEFVDRTIPIPRSYMENSVKGLFVRRLKAKLEDPALSQEEKDLYLYALKTGLYLLERGAL